MNALQTHDIRFIEEDAYSRRDLLEKYHIYRTPAMIYQDAVYYNINSLLMNM